MVHEIVHSPLLQLTLLFLVGVFAFLALSRNEPSWRVVIVRGTFVGSLVLLFSFHSGWTWRVDLPIPESIAAVPGAMSNSGESIRPSGSVIETPAGVVNESVSFTSEQLFIIWAVGAICLLLRLSIGVFRQIRRFSGSRRASKGLQQYWDEVCRESAIRATGVRVVDEPVSPHLHFNGVLLLPATLLPNNKASADLIPVLRHEAAHLRSADHYWFPFASVFTSLFWFHPLAWWLASKHLDACEEARDAEAARFSSPSDYSASVAKTALHLVPASIVTPSLIRRRSRLLTRLDRVERSSKISPPRRSFLWITSSALCLLATALGSISPVRAVADNGDDSIEGVWKAHDPGSDFARQIEIYEWSGKMSLRIWFTTGGGMSADATVIPLKMTREEVDALTADGKPVVVVHDFGFMTSTMSLDLSKDGIEFVNSVVYVDDSGRNPRESIYHFTRGKHAGSR